MHYFRKLLNLKITYFSMKLTHYSPRLAFISLRLFKICDFYLRALNKSLAFLKSSFNLFQRSRSTDHRLCHSTIQIISQSCCMFRVPNVCRLDLGDVQ